MKAIKDSEQITIGINKDNEIAFIFHKDVTAKPITVHLNDANEFLIKMREKILFARKHNVKLNFTRWEQVVS